MLVVIYFGRISDVKAVVELVKKNGVKIICIIYSYYLSIAKLVDYIICLLVSETSLLGRNVSVRIL